MNNSDFASKFLGVVNNPPRNGFDLSRKECYSLPFGIISPVSFEFCQPNEHYKGSVSSYVQTNSMRDDNFCTLYNHMKAVFVPMSSLKRNFLQFTPLADKTRLRLDKSIPQRYCSPHLRSTEFIKLFFPWYFINYLLSNAVTINQEILNYRVNCNYDTSEEYPSVSDYTYSIYDENRNPVLVDSLLTSNPYAYALMSMMSQTWTEPTEHHIVNSVPFFETLYINLQKLINPSGEFFVFDALRVADALGFGNYWSIFNDLAVSIFDDFIYHETYHVLSPSQYLVNSFYEFIKIKYYGTTFGNDFKIDMSKFDHFYGAKHLLTNPIDMSLDSLVAFKYYISMCERSNYRNPDTFVFTLDYFSTIAYNADISQNDYNVDDYENDISFAHFIDVNDSDIFDFSMLKEYISKLFDSNPLDLFETDGYYLNVILYLFSLSNPLLRSDLVTSSQLTKISGAEPTATNVTIQNINEVSALYKVRQNLLRAGVRASNYMKAFFGIKGDDHITEPVLVLDDTRNIVNITGLINQAATDVAELGARAAKGNGSAGLSFNFDTSEYGFLFYIQYLTCDVFYENYRIDRFNRLTPNDVVIPQDANLGLSPIYASDIELYSKNFYDGSWYVNTHSSVLGYSSRDWPYKSKFDLVHGFFTNTPLSYRSTNFSNIESISKLPTLSRGNAARGGFVVTLSDQQRDRFMHDEDIYFNPTMCNGIFTQLNDGLLFASAQYDAFTIITQFNIHKVSPMATIGLPKTI